VYGWSFYTAQFGQVSGIWGRVLAATMAAFLGAFIGARLIKKVTLTAIQDLVAAMLLVVGFAMAAGLV
ncbi:MAG: sulfite exporter TauE/SafE family protein, partial [Anaerolineales bacterium]